MLLDAIVAWCGVLGGCNRPMVEAAFGTVVGGSILLAIVGAVALVAVALRAAIRRSR